MDLQLQGRKALVTGSYRGTGQIIAQTLAREGAEVYVHGLEAGQAEATVDELGIGIPVTGDITTTAGTDSLLASLEGRSVDILVNNYGTADAGSWSALESSDWITAYEKNVLSAQRLIRHFLPPMREATFARIINLGTIGSTRPNSRSPHYYAAKGALATMTVSLAKELAGTHVRVNLVSPGMILTPEVQQGYLQRGRRKGWGTTWEEIEPHVAEEIPIGRIVLREEVADLVAFLASPRADAIHGQNIGIDGGVLDIVR